MKRNVAAKLRRLLLPLTFYGSLLVSFRRRPGRSWSGEKDFDNEEESSCRCRRHVVAGGFSNKCQCICWRLGVQQQRRWSRDPVSWQQLRRHFSPLARHRGVLWTPWGILRNDAQCSAEQWYLRRADCLVDFTRLRRLYPRLCRELPGQVCLLHLYRPGLGMISQ